MNAEKTTASGTPSSTQQTRELYTPKFLTILQLGYGWALFRRDIVSGLTVAIVALPLAMALAIASGAAPEKGLVTVVVGGLLISLLGGSRYQIGGPTGAFVVVVFNVIHTYGYDGLILATSMAGLMLVAAGVFRLGTYIKYIPQPVVIGFTAGIGLIIFSSQVKEFLGLSIQEVPADFIMEWQAYINGASAVSLASAAFSFGCLFAIIVLRRYLPRIPAFLVVIIVSGLAVWMFALPIHTVGTLFGGIPQEFPLPSLPVLSWPSVKALLPSAFTIAFLAGVESLLSAVVADGMTGRRHRSNCELIAQGVANVASAAFGGLPVTGAIARTATNIRAGAYSPVSGILHAVFVLLFMLTLAPLASYVPMSALAAILFIVAWDMSELHRVWNLLKGPRSDAFVFSLTFGLTVLVDLTVAIEVGVVLAAILFTHRMANAVEVETSHHLIAEDRPDDLTAPFAESGIGSSPSHDIQIYRISGPFFFGAAAKLSEVLNRIGTFPKVVILCLDEVPFMDSTGASALDEFIRNCTDRHQAHVILCGLRAPVKKMFSQSGYLHSHPRIAFSKDVLGAKISAQDVIRDRDEATS